MHCRILEDLHPSSFLSVEILYRTEYKLDGDRVVVGTGVTQQSCSVNCTVVTVAKSADLLGAVLVLGSRASK